MYIIKNGTIILQGQRNFVDGLWDVPFYTLIKKLNVAKHKLLSTIEGEKTSYELANYLHACACSPAIRTFQEAIKNNFFQTWPGIKILNFKHFITYQTNIATGHLDQAHKNIQSTKLSHPEPKAFTTMTKIIPFSAKEMSYADMTGAFPYTSRRAAATIAEACTDLHARLTADGHTTSMFILDNKFSNHFKKALQKKNLRYQLVPPVGDMVDQSLISFWHLARC